MPNRSAAKNYTQSSLEIWLTKLNQPWEPAFTPQELDTGRQFYKQGIVRQIDLQNYDAIIYTKIDKEERYSVIDWNGALPHVRCSIEDTFWGRALAVAGFYEIEELIAEEALDLPDQSINEEHESSAEDEISQTRIEYPTRPLSLNFYIQSHGLFFEAYWLEKNHRQQALDSKHSAAQNPSEREKIIHLSHLARRNQFHFAPKRKAYLLSNLQLIPSFVNEKLDSWAQYFDIELTPEVEALGRGPKPLILRADTSTQNKDQFSLDWQLFINELALTAREQHKLLSQHDQLALLPKHGLVKLSSDQKDTLSDWKQWITQQENQGTLPNYMLFSLFAKGVHDLKLNPDLHAWRDSFSKLATDTQANLLSILRPYQREGVQWLAHLCKHNCHALLADEMGLGKTLQVLSLLHAYPIENKNHLIVCPASVVPVWEQEVARFFPQTEVKVLNKHTSFDEEQASCLWIASYTQLRRHKHLLAHHEFGYAVLDEAQFIKNPDTKVSQACLTIQAKHRIALTGTPLENKYLDLWTLFRFLMPGLLGSRQTFEHKYHPDNAPALQELHHQLAPFILRRTKDVVAKDLPQKTEINLECTLTPLQKEWYSKLTQEGLKALEETSHDTTRRNAFHLFTLLTRLRQACCDPALLPKIPADTAHSGKTTLLLEKLKIILASGHKVVLFSQFTRFLDRVKQALETEFPDTPIYQLTGKTKDRSIPIHAFQNTTSSSIMLVSLRAGGTGITLHAADYVFLLDPWWNPAVEAQAIDRVHRIGQTNPVFVYRLIAQGTIEERIQNLKTHKAELFNNLVQTITHPSLLEKHLSTFKALIELSE